MKNVASTTARCVLLDTPQIQRISRGDSATIAINGIGWIDSILKQLCSTEEFHTSEKVVCPSCNSEIENFVYMFQLKLEDETGSLLVIVYKEDAVCVILIFMMYWQENFLGIPPSNFYINNISESAVVKKINKLLEPNVWMSCCIKSYTANNQRKYRLFDTMLDSSQVKSSFLSC